MRIFNPIATGSLTISGSIISDRIQSITVTTASLANSVQFSSILSKPTLVSGSGQITYSNISSIPSGIISSSAQVNYSGSYDTVVVKVVNDGGNKYQIDGQTAPALTLQRGHTYRFDLSDSSNSGHPLAFRYPNNTSYTDNVRQSGTAGKANAYTQIHIGYNTPVHLRYYCTVHGNGMGNFVRTSDLHNFVASGSAVI